MIGVLWCVYIHFYCTYIWISYPYPISYHDHYYHYIYISYHIISYIYIYIMLHIMIYHIDVFVVFNDNNYHYYYYDYYYHYYLLLSSLSIITCSWFICPCLSLWSPLVSLTHYLYHISCQYIIVSYHYLPYRHIFLYI